MSPGITVAVSATMGTRSEAFACTNLTRGLNAVQVGHLDIHEDELRPQPLGLIYRVQTAVGDCESALVNAQVFGQSVDIGHVVIGDEDQGILLLALLLAIHIPGFFRFGNRRAPVHRR